MENKGREALNTLIGVLVTEARWDDVQFCIHQFTSEVDETNADRYMEYLLISRGRPSSLIYKLFGKGLMLSGPGTDKLMDWCYSNKIMKLAAKAGSLKPEEARVSRLVDIGCIIDPTALLNQSGILVPLVSKELQKRFVESLIHRNLLCDAWDVATESELLEYIEAIPEIALGKYKAESHREYITDAVIMEDLYERIIKHNNGPNELAYKFSDWLAICFWHMKRKDDYLKWAELRQKPGPTAEEKPQVESDRWKVFNI